MPPVSALQEDVYRANLALVDAGLVTLSFGNASGLDRSSGVFVIKPSGIPYDRLRPENMVAVSLADETVVEGDLRPSSDTPTHAALYRRLRDVGGVVHTHSPYAAAWAQAGRSIPCLGTTHADHFAGPIPVTRDLTPEEVAGAYEGETGDVIAETLEELGLLPLAMPAALVASHGPFTWGRDAAEAVTNAIALEAVAALAHRSLALSPNLGAIGDPLRRRHFSRKHGPEAYYGQPAEPRKSTP
jgi:L-ribulose-5-phosphate 4-epimerase